MTARDERPTDAPEPPFVEETLAWCNRLRARDGKRQLKRLPVGKPRDPLSCPCGKATGRKVLSERYSVPSGYAPLPSYVRLFVIAFDNGDLPQYRVPRGAVGS